MDSPMRKAIRIKPRALRSKKDEPSRHIYFIWAFLIPFIGMLVVMLLNRCEPFGDNYAFLYSDQYHQYYPFFLSFREALLSGDSLLYCWDIGMGIDFLGLIAYYLGSPLNLLSVLVPESLTLEYFAMLMPIKLGLASLFFAIFLNRIFEKNDISIAVFGAFYGLCSWALGYQWNVMWLDTFALLPLVVLGTVSLLRDRKFILYTVSLFLAVAINYYIGFFVCIFVLLLCICYEICRFQGLRKAFADFGLMVLFTALALGMTLLITLPAYAALQNTYSVVNNFPEDFALNIVDSDLCADAKAAWAAFKTAGESGESLLTQTGYFFVAIKESILPILDGMRQVAGNMGGALQLNFKESDGLPHLYCGVGTIGMAFLFLCAKEVKVRDKLCSVALLIFFMLSFIIRQLDYIWHGFHFTNMIPYRFSFLFSFVMLYMAYRAWLLRHSFKLWQIIVAGVLSIGILLCAWKFTFAYIAFNLAFLLLYLGVFAFIIIERKLAAPADEEADPQTIAARKKILSQRITFVFAAIMVLELALSLANFSMRFSRTSISNYPRNAADTQSAISYMEYRERNTPFYRAEVTHTQTINDGALNGYHGITIFSSSANVRATNFMIGLAFAGHDAGNRFIFEESSPVANLFLNLKYMIERDGDVEQNSYFSTVHNFGDVYLLENNDYLPLGFLTESSLKDLKFEKTTNGFEQQNILFSLATGIEEDVWTILDSDALEVTVTDGITIASQTASGLTGYSNADTAGTIRYTYTVDTTGFLCLEMRMTKKNSFNIYKNDQELYNESLSSDQMLSVSEVVPGDTIEIEITCKSEESGSVAARAGVLKEKVFHQGYEVLKASTLELTEFSNTKVAGTIDCNRDGLMYTSIPYDSNWSAEVDGEPAELVLVGDCMIALELTEGVHEITFTYRNKAFTTGLILSLSCAAVFAGIIVLTRVLPKRRGKYEKSITE